MHIMQIVLGLWLLSVAIILVIQIFKQGEDDFIGRF